MSISFASSHHGKKLKVHGGTKQENWIVAAISFKPQLTLILVEDWGWECKSVGRVKTCGKVFSRTSNQGRVQVRQLGGRLGGKKRLLSSSSLCLASISPSENWSASGLASGQSVAILGGNWGKDRWHCLSLISPKNSLPHCWLQLAGLLRKFFFISRFQHISFEDMQSVNLYIDENIRPRSYGLQRACKP